MIHSSDDYAKLNSDLVKVGALIRPIIVRDSKVKGCIAGEFLVLSRKNKLNSDVRIFLKAVKVSSKDGGKVV